MTKYLDQNGIPEGFEKVEVHIARFEVIVTALLCKRCQMSVLQDHRNTYALKHTKWHEELDAALAGDPMGKEADSL